MDLHPVSSSSEPRPARGPEDVRLRLAEAVRRAEIVTLLNSARSEGEICDAVTSELAAAYEAYVAFVIVRRTADAPPELASSVGLDRDAGEKLLHHPAVIGALERSGGTVIGTETLPALDAREIVVAAQPVERGAVLVGVARLTGGGLEGAERALLDAISQSLAHALEREWAAEERDRRAAEQAALVRAAHSLNGSLQRDEILATLCEEVRAALGADGVGALLGEEGEEIVCVAVSGLPEDLVGYREGPDQGLTGAAVRTGKPQVSHAYQEEGHAPAHTAALNHIRVAACVPLRWRDRARGALWVGFEESRWVSERDLEALGGFAELAGLACSNAESLAEARLAADQDLLTGCLNQAAALRALGEQAARAERTGERLSLILLDLDDFKAINDRYGHLSGDSVLRGVGNVLRDVVRPYDVVGRYGGDEFALILPDVGQPEAMPVVERIGEALTRVPVPGRPALLCRAGIAEWEPGEPVTSLVERADQAMRAAKAGRPRSDSRDAPPSPAAAGAGARRRADKRDARLAAAGRIGVKLSRELGVDRIAALAAEELATMLPGCTATVLRLEGEGALAVVASSGPLAGGKNAVGERVSQDEGVAGRCLRERRPVMINEASAGPGGMPGPEFAVPLFTGPSAWGVVRMSASNPDCADHGDAQLVEAVAEHLSAALTTAELYSRLERTHRGVAEALAAALEAKDHYTADHARSIADMAVRVGERMGLRGEALVELRYGALFHDVGKIAVPDAILKKPSSLAPEEVELVKHHPLIGEQILAPVPFLSGARRIVRHDHERWDGTGYPDGLHGPQIPLGARIVFVVDAYHAMISQRPYREGMDREDAIAELRDNAGSQFDPEVVEEFLAALDGGSERPEVRPDAGVRA